ncbi:hypothetical protein AB6A40_001223 [Gnathostoma spinigerum]|uniref:Aminopeptidase n=1 Tax=Gnathostoma spinigerum TaxID=75299 RepID=A0ABD6E8N0_9BILA
MTATARGLSLTGTHKRNRIRVLTYCILVGVSFVLICFLLFALLITLQNAVRPDITSLRENYAHEDVQTTFATPSVRQASLTNTHMDSTPTGGVLTVDHSTKSTTAGRITWKALEEMNVNVRSSSPQLAVVPVEHTTRETPSTSSRNTQLLPDVFSTSADNRAEPERTISVDNVSDTLPTVSDFGRFNNHEESISDQNVDDYVSPLISIIADSDVATDAVTDDGSYNIPVQSVRASDAPVMLDLTTISTPVYTPPSFAKHMSTLLSSILTTEQSVQEITSYVNFTKPPAHSASEKSTATTLTVDETSAKINDMVTTSTPETRTMDSMHSTTPEIVAKLQRIFRKVTCTAAYPSQCTDIQRVENDSAEIPTEIDVAESGTLGGWIPIHYELEININRDEHTSFNGSVKMSLELIANVSSIIFAFAGKNIADIRSRNIRLFDCRTGEQICLKKFHYSSRHEVFVLEADRSFIRGDIITLEFAAFHSSSAAKGFIVQNPQHWESRRPWIVSTLFQMRNARSVFPCFDLPSLKATMSMCVTHPSGTHSRSNTPEKSRTMVNGKAKSCFERTPPMSTYLYSFAVFNKMNIIKDPTKNETSAMPNIEIIQWERMPADTTRWMVEEAFHAIRFMQNLTGWPYSLPKLTFIVAPLQVSGVENYGIITISEQWVARPKYSLAHETLAHEVAHQWVGNLITLKHWSQICIQEGLANFLQWQIRIADSKDQQVTAGIIREAEYIRKLRQQRNDGIERDVTLRLPVVRDLKTIDEVSLCFQKSPTFFRMVEDGFGPGVVAKALRILINEYAYQSVGLDEWAKAFSQAASNPLAGKFFLDFFQLIAIPLIHVSYSPTELIISQENFINESGGEEGSLVVPLRIATDLSQNRTPIVLSRTTEAFPLNYSRLAVVNPDAVAYAIVTYEPSSYIQMLQCSQSPLCETLDNTSMGKIVEDFCLAFVNNRLKASVSSSETLPFWVEFMRLLSSTSLPSALCSCCLHRKPVPPSCRWQWNDQCKNLSILQDIENSM